MARTKSRKKKRTITVNRWLSLAILILSFFSLTRLGFVGLFSANLLRFFVGDLYQFFSLFIMVVSLFLLFQGEIKRDQPSRIVIGLLLVFVAGLVLMHALLFQGKAHSNFQVLSLTWQSFWKDFSRNVVHRDLGGGMLGALLYGVFHFLFDQVGSYVVVGVLMLTGILMLLDISYGQFFKGIASLIKNIWAFFQSVASKLSEGRKKRSQKQAQVSKDVVQDQVQAQETTGGQKEERGKVPIEVHQRSARSRQARQLSDKQEESQSSESADSQLEASSIPAPQLDEQTLTEEDLKEADFDHVSEQEDESYVLPDLSLLNDRPPADQSNEYQVIEENIKKLEQTFDSFDVDAKVVKANLGPAVTKYEIQPATGVKVSKIVNLQDDIALALAAQDIRIEAPIPGRALIGIEVPNQDISFVSFRETMEFTERDPEHLLEVPIGKDISGRIQVADLAKMPHLLIAGSTGSGKSVAINSIITALLMRTKPSEVKLMMIDPKMVELNDYNGVPHLLTPVVTNPKKAARALNNVVQEMERRYELFASTGTKNRATYNDYVRQHNLEEGDNLPLLPYIVVIVDELADLMMVASKEVEDAIMRLAQMARAAGIHMIIATQRPSVDVLTGTIKANIPSRMAFAVSSGTDSRTILDMTGAEKLLGKGDMLYLPMGANQPIRVQGTFIADDEVKRVVDFVKDQQEVRYVEEMIPQEESSSEGLQEVDDEYFDEAVQLVIEEGAASVSMLQRRFRIGYNRAARLMDDMEARGIVGPPNGSKPRDVLIEQASGEGQADEVLED